MNLRKAPDQEKLRICRIYYLAGFVFLPFLWLVNFVWFFQHAFVRKPFPEQAQIKKYLVHSLIGVCVWICLIITWNVVFQLKRVDWGSVGDDLTFIVPRGKA